MTREGSRLHTFSVRLRAPKGKSGHYSRGYVIVPEGLFFLEPSLWQRAPLVVVATQEQRWESSGKTAGPEGV